MAKNNYNNNSSESLERSHSKVSNAKLTLLCFGAILALSLAVISIALFFKYSDNLIFLFASIGSTLLFLLFCLGFSHFTR